MDSKHPVPDQDDENDPPAAATKPSGRGLQLALVIALLLALVTAGTYGWRNHMQEQQIEALQAQARLLQLRAPGSILNQRLKPTRSGSGTGAVLDLGWPDPPQLLELRIDVSDSKFNAYQVTLDKTGEARVMQIRRVARDSNNELRLALNSSAFGPGEYQLRLEGYSWRGELSEVGRVTLKLER